MMRETLTLQKYGIDIIEVIKPESDSEIEEGTLYTGSGIMVNSGEYDGINSEEFKT